MVMEMREKGKGELVCFSPERSSQWLTFLSHILVVELGLTGLTSTSRSSRTTCSKSLALLRSSVSVLSVRPRILFVVEFEIAEMACVSSNVRRTFNVPSGVRVQRSISKRDFSHPGYQNTLVNISLIHFRHL